jgi:hypothetical protein
VSTVTVTEYVGLVLGKVTGIVQVGFDMPMLPLQPTPHVELDWPEIRKVAKAPVAVCVFWVQCAVMLVCAGKFASPGVLAP